MQFPSPVLPFNAVANAQITIEREVNYVEDVVTGNLQPIYGQLNLDVFINRTDDKNKQKNTTGVDEQIIELRGYVLNAPDGWLRYKFDGVVRCTVTYLDSNTTVQGELTINPTITPFLKSFATKNLFPFWAQFKQIEGFYNDPGDPPDPIVSSKFWIATEIDLASPTYYYYGGNQLNGKWKINRYNKVSLVKESATQIENAAYLSLSEAWLVRSDLVYEEVL